MTNKRTAKQRAATLAAMGERLRTLRCSYRWRQIEISKQTGISPSSWNSYEKGKKKISVDHAEQLANITGVSLDWIYLGRTYHLSEPLLERLTNQTNSVNGNGHSKPPTERDK